MYVMYHWHDNGDKNRCCADRRVWWGGRAAQEMDLPVEEPHECSSLAEGEAAMGDGAASEPAAADETRGTERGPADDDVGEQQAGQRGEQQGRAAWEAEHSAAEMEGDTWALSQELDSSAALQEAQQHAEDVRLTHAEKAQLYTLRRHLDQLWEAKSQTETLIQQTGEELRGSRLREQELRREQQITQQQMRQAADATSTAAMSLLQRQETRTKEEVDTEQSLQDTLSQTISQHQLALCALDVELGRFSQVQQHVQEAEHAIATQQHERAEGRIALETAKATAAQRSVEAWKRQRSQEMMALEERRRQAAEEVARNQQRARHFLRDTVAKARQREAEEEEKVRQDNGRRLKSIMTLKQSIANNKENLRTLRARQVAEQAARTQEEERERAAILASGGNPTEVLLKRKRLEEFERTKREFEEQVKARQVDIIEHILKEEADMKRRSKQQQRRQHLAAATASRDAERAAGTRLADPRVIRLLEEALGETGNSQAPPLRCRSPSPDSDGDGEHAGLSALGETVAMATRSPGDEEEEDDLIQSEYPGLWEPEDEQSTKRDSATGQDVKTHPFRPSKAEGGGPVLKEKPKGQRRLGLTVQGRSFSSKPNVIAFKNFDVGKIYKLKVVLTNVSYTSNFCRYKGMSEHLEDYVSVRFKPPGQMSAGMSFELMVTFEATKNEDLNGELQFAAQSGPFTVPVQCTTKKCDVTVDRSKIDFDTHVVGETIRRTFTLVNRGALGTRFRFVKADYEEAQEVRAAPRVAPGGGGEDAGSVSSQRGVASTEAAAAEAEGEPGDSSEMVESDCSRNSPEKGGVERATETPDPALPEELRTGEVVEGELPGLGYVKLEVVFTPTVPGDTRATFHVHFTDPGSPRLEVRASALAVDVPVWVQRPNVDLKICTFDRLYQDSVLVHNRATTALRLKFEVCRQLQNYLEVLPKNGYIQAQSTFSAQLKFLPRQSMAVDAPGYFDKDTCVLEAPILIRVGDQTKPVPFTVHAIITSSDLHFDRAVIDFGCCTIFESVKATVKLTNDSILAQDFGFVTIPEYVDVQPNHGFGTVLPLDTVLIDIIFSATKAKEYKFDLTCKSGTNRDFQLRCVATGVHPPLELSHSLLRFRATAVGDTSVASLHVVNSHTSANEYSHPVPRVGRGDVAPVGPTSFQFVVPPDCPLSVSPAVGTVAPGLKQLVRLLFRPVLSEQQVLEEMERLSAVRKAKSIAKLSASSQAQPIPTAASKPAGKKGPLINKKRLKEGHKKSGKEPGNHTTHATPDPVNGNVFVEPVLSKEDELVAARASLLREFPGSYSTHTVACFVVSGNAFSQSQPGQLKCSVHNTLYLEVHCPAVSPPLICVSDNGRTTLDFGQACIGQTVTKRITVENISNQHLKPTCSLLDPLGPFTLLNALRPISPGCTHTLVLAFAALQQRQFHERLEVQAGGAVLTLTLVGRAQLPLVTCSLEEPCLSLGPVLSCSTASAGFKLHNDSSVPVSFLLTLDSESPGLHSSLPILAPSGGSSSSSSSVGTQNHSGLSVFSVQPVQGIIPVGGDTELLVTFSPDHASARYSDRLRLLLFGKEFRVIELKGCAVKHMLYLEGGDPLDVAVESLAPLPVWGDDESSDVAATVKPFLLTMRSTQTDDGFSPVTRELFVGCVCPAQSSSRKGGEFIFDNIAEARAKGFTVEPVRGSVEAGHKKSVCVTWSPVDGQDPWAPASASVSLSLRSGDATEAVAVLLRATPLPAAEGPGA
ncbi:cilia- and flagella-associated protein 74 isoform X2 [Lethenteron reissneri]|uniref:cilia- and flagella-associated protein 74 isoform X2 n=1 Tax=Lethenteron reissneri TaxID=7753 RepID=UPI002AB73E86|nr:cilia- and flagella-associated protein 74 isoform X2 [Lethenteron reissneri]